MALDSVVAFADVLAEVAAPGTEPAEVELAEVEPAEVGLAEVDPAIVAEPAEAGIAAAAAVAVLALDTAHVLGVVAAVESGLDNVAVELEADMAAAVAPGPGGIAVRDLRSVAVVPVPPDTAVPVPPDTAKDGIAEVVTVAGTMETVEQNNSLQTNKKKMSRLLRNSQFA